MPQQINAKITVETILQLLENVIWVQITPKVVVMQTVILKTDTIAFIIYLHRGFLVSQPAF